MTTLTEAWRTGLARDASKPRKQIAVPIVIFIASCVRIFSPWVLPVIGLTLLVWAAFLVAAAAGLASAGIACFIVRALYELQGRK